MLDQSLELIRRVARRGSAIRSSNVTSRNLSGLIHQGAEFFAFERIAKNFDPLRCRAAAKLQLTHQHEALIQLTVVVIGACDDARQVFELGASRTGLFRALILQIKVGCR